METCYARALEIVREHHEEIQALYLELWHRKVREADMATSGRSAQCISWGQRGLVD
jgi:hypothetical protein